MTVDREGKVPLYRQIEQQIRALILEGILPAGHRLPSERELAERLGVNRTTVVNAYGSLAADGLVEGRVGVGTVVLGATEELAEPPALPLAWSGLMRSRPRWPETGIGERVAQLSSRPGVISFATGVADITGSPHLALAQVVQRVVNSRMAALLEDSPIAGLTPLREELARELRFKGCRDASAGQVIVTSGTQQGLYLVARLLLDPGDVVLVESPTYLGALSVFRSIGARPVGVPVDDEGMQVEAAGHYLAHADVRLIYTNPNFQNPTGSLMSLDRRAALLALARRHQIPILEDDLHGELHFEDPLPPPIRSLDDGGYVVYLGGLSSLLGSGLRLGWVLAPPPIVEPLLRLRQDMDLHPNNLVQLVVHDLLRGESFPAHLHWLRQTFRRRRDAMLQALERHMPAGVGWSQPAGGLYVWCALPDGVASSDLLERAGELGVSFAPGPMFFTHAGGEGFMRLGFAFRSEGEIAEGVRRLARAIEDLARRPGVRRADPSQERPFV
ncbi:MAG: PLP-dependent aminotransferase family protein [Anaerolineae bacterium]|nr:PLP-dependent aminotransferase family protein [Anaerolineae bacterium]